ncbi:MAG: hypothetical protein ABI707_00290 [Ferruginibacter sp.]
MDGLLKDAVPAIDLLIKRKKSGKINPGYLIEDNTRVQNQPPPNQKKDLEKSMR